MRIIIPHSKFRIPHFLVVGVLAGLASLGAGNCAPANRDELAKEVLQADPKFDRVMEKYRELVNRIETYEQELALKRQTVDESIAQLKKDLVATETSVKAKIEETKKKIEPELQAEEQALAASGQELRAKQVQRAALGKSMAQLGKLLKSQENPLTPEARANEEGRLNEMNKQASQLDLDMATLKANIRLHKIKLILLKF